MDKRSKNANQNSESENEFRLLAEAMPQIVWVTRADGWNTYFNQQWVDYTGLTLEESYGHGWNKPFHPDDQQRAWDAWQNAVKTTATYSLECRLRRADGVYRWWLIRGVPVRNNAGYILKWVGTCTDIDDIKQAETQLKIACEREQAAEALRESIRREKERSAELAALLDAAPIAIFIAHDPDCLHITGNAAADELLRNPRGGEASLNAPGDNSPSHFRAFKDARELSIDELPAQCAARGLPVKDFEFSLVFDNGMTRNVIANATSLREENGRIRGAVLVMVDITERKKAEAALRESEELYRAIGESIDYGVWVCDSEGRNIYASPSYLKLVGMTQDQCSNFGWGDVLHPDDAENTIAAWKECARTGNLWDVEHRFRGVDGTWHPILARGVPVRDDNGKIKYWAGINLDISKLKQVEKELRKSEQRYRLLVEQAADGIFVADAQGRYVDVNPAGAAMLGYTREEILRLSLPDLLTAEDIEHLAPLVAKYEGGAIVRSEWRFRRKDGSLFPGELMGRELPDGRLQGILRDITERKLIEDTLRFLVQCDRAPSGEDMFQSMARFLANTLNMDYVCFDLLEERMLEARTLAVYFDGKFEDNITYTLKETPCGVVVEDSVCCFHSDVRNLFPKDEVLQEMKAEGYLGTVLWSSKGQPIGLIALISRQPLAETEIASGILQLVAVRAAGELERRQAEDVLHENQERLALAADAGQIGMFDMNMETGDVQWTRQHEIIFGYAPTATDTTATTTHTYRDWADRVHPVDLLNVEERMRQAMEERVPFQIEYRLIWPDGSVHWVHVASKYYFDDNGHCTRLMGAVRDITSKKQLEEALQEYNELLETRVEERTAQLREKDQLLIQQSRLAAMGEMVGNIAHQWRQPLNVLGMKIQSLPIFYDIGEFSKEFLDKTTTDSMNLINHMSQTIDDFRHFFKPDKEKTNFCVNKAIRQAIALIENMLTQDQINVVMNLDNEVFINGYPNEFSQVILCLLQNTRDVLLERKVKDGRVTIDLTLENGRVAITLADNGGGISDEIIGKIFEPYFSTKGLQGTGIGLYMSKNIIEKNMGGSLTVRNNAEGAEFRIEV